VDRTPQRSAGNEPLLFPLHQMKMGSTYRATPPPPLAPSSSSGARPDIDFERSKRKNDHGDWVR
jgi:hypothetical protein